MEEFGKHIIEALAVVAGVLATTLFSIVGWFLKKLGRKQETMEVRINELERRMVPREEIKKDLIELKTSQDKHFEYLRERLDRLVERQIDDKHQTPSQE